MTALIPDKIFGKVISQNSTTTPLGGAGSFTGTWTNTVFAGIIYISVYSNVDSATDGLAIQQSSDGSNIDHQKTFTITAAVGVDFAIRPTAKYFRIVYTNGAGAQATFRLQSIIKYIGKSTSIRISDAITEQNDAELTKSVLTGSDPDGNYIDFKATRQENLGVSINEYGDTPGNDAFFRRRVSQPYTIFDSKHLYDKQPLFYDESTGGSATSTHSTTNARVRMTVTSSASDFVIRQTFQRFNYQPGKSPLMFLSLLASQETGVTKRIGLFDGTGANYLTANNGIFLTVGESSISWNIAKNGSTTETVSQANWNVDPMDGTGPSGNTLDLDAIQLICIDYEWLASGRVRCGFVIGGMIQYVHYFEHANDPSFTSAYMSTPNLPIRYDIVSDGTGGGDLDHICGTVMSEGGLEDTGFSHSVDTNNTHLDANVADTPYILLALRLKTTHLDATVITEYFSMISETNDDFKWSLLLNPTYNGSLSYSDVTNSACQFAAGATANDITDDGTKMDSGYAKSSESLDRPLKTARHLGSQIDGTRDELILAVTPLSSNADIQGSLSFRELL